MREATVRNEIRPALQHQDYRQTWLEACELMRASRELVRASRELRAESERRLEEMYDLCTRAQQRADEARAWIEVVRDQRNLPVVVDEAHPRQGPMRDPLLQGAQ